MFGSEPEVVRAPPPPALVDQLDPRVGLPAVEGTSHAIFVITCAEHRDLERSHRRKCSHDVTRKGIEQEVECRRAVDAPTPTHGSGTLLRRLWGNRRIDRDIWKQPTQSKPPL